jgi:hypothetical protein
VDPALSTGGCVSTLPALSWCTATAIRQRRLKHVAASCCLLGCCFRTRVLD